MISEIIKKQIEVALARAGFDLSREVLTKWDIELTKDFAHGDYASNVALLIANGKSEMVNGKSSKEIAEKLLPHLGTDPDGYIEKVEKEAELMTPVRDDTTQKVLVQSSTPQKPKIKLPLSEGQIEEGLHHKIWESIRWLAEWCKRQVEILYT